VTRRLSLARETLAELSAGDLSAVAGAAVPTVPLADCLSAKLARTQCECPTLAPR
jgi:orotate phosphoribosyltransferase